MSCCDPIRWKVEKLDRSLDELGLELASAEDLLRSLRANGLETLDRLVDEIGRLADLPGISTLVTALKAAQAQLAVDEKTLEQRQQALDAAQRTLDQARKRGYSIPDILPLVAAVAQARAELAVAEGRALIAETTVEKAVKLLTGALGLLPGGVLESLGLVGYYLEILVKARLTQEKVKGLRLRIDSQCVELETARQQLADCLSNCKRRIVSYGLFERPRYLPVPVGRLNPNPYGAPTSVEVLGCRGLVGGRSRFTSAQYHPFVKRPGRYITDLLEDFGTGLGRGGSVTGINGRGQVVGYFGRDYQERLYDVEAFLWDEKTEQRRPIVADGSTMTTALGITEDGHILCTMQGRAGAVLVRDDKVVDRFLDLEGPVAMNALGEITGTRFGEGTVTSYFRDTSGRVSDIPPPPGASWMYAKGIGPAGHVVGYCEGQPPYVRSGFVWHASEGTRAIPGFGGTDTKAWGVNSDGVVVGFSGRVGVNGAEEAVAFIRDPSTGELTDLNALIPSESRVKLFAAYCIDDLGNIGTTGVAPDTIAMGYVLKSRRFDWGARVKVTRKNGKVETDYLVSFEPDLGRLVLQRSVVEFDDGAIGVRFPVPLDDVARIEIDTPPDGFNLYILAYVQDGVVKGLTVEIIGYDGASDTWRYRSRQPRGRRVVFAQGSTQVRGLWAIPRVDGDEAGPDDVLRTIAAAAAGITCPPQVLAAMAYEESKGDSLPWRQFAPPYPQSCRLATLITAEGAIGMMQLTTTTAVLLANPQWDEEPTSLPPNIVEHLFRLAADANYNVEAGARVLRYKQRHPPVATLKRRYGYVELSGFAIEHWFHAVGRYNGAISYAKRIWAHMANAPYPVAVERVDATVPGTEPPETAFPAHLDTDRDGKVDLLIPRPEVEVGTATVTLTVRPSSSGLPVYVVRAGLVTKTGYTLPIDIGATAEGAFVGDVPLDQPGVDRPFGEQLVRVTVRAGAHLLYVDFLPESVFLPSQ